MWHNQKEQKIVFPYVKLTNLLSLYTKDFQKVDQQKVDQQKVDQQKVVNPRHQTPQGQPVTTIMMKIMMK